MVETANDLQLVETRIDTLVLLVIQAKWTVEVKLEAEMVGVHLAQQSQETGRDDKQRDQIVVARLQGIQHMVRIDDSELVLAKINSLKVIFHTYPATVVKGYNKIG